MATGLNDEKFCIIDNYHEIGRISFFVSSKNEKNTSFPKYLSETKES